ncbi:UBP1-associated protein 2A [Carica papaya]|uniref:UBP1-associated protein 2A n=1 Tax=Carica papaya TaxID=3649 RepID=UPI000B8D1BC6|nr:UBP1-associated protein 2A [Carica papaya]XP_021901352.1 UBP1-associated protein 2A [Carica papaya]XP_021901354.1 UBP1-associated protein 2A [Carica papaya]
MAKKRKHDSKSSEPTEPPQKQQQHNKQQEEEQEQLQIEDQENIEDVEEEVEEVEEEEDEEDEEGEGEDQDAGTVNSETNQADDEDDEPIEKLLEPFGKDQLTDLLREAAHKHRDVADLIRKLADEDPVHRKIFVHGLGWDTKAETLVDAFKQYGEIEDSKAVTDKISGKSKGYGFILFKTRTGARRALKQPQKKIGNRMTACQLASVGPVPTPTAQPSAPAQPVSEYTQRKIYVSNVGADLDPQKLHSFFAKYGDIEEGPLGLDKMTGKPKGFCLFVYRNVESARKALDEPHKNFEGHILHCQKAIDGPKPGKSQHQHHRNTHNSHFQRNDSGSFAGGAATGTGHLMAPSGPGIGANAAQALNPALGQALTALFATQGAGLGLNPALGQALLGTLGSAAAVNPGVPSAGAGIQGGYGSQANISPGVIGGYGSQGGLQAAYPNQQMGQGGAGRGQHGVGQYGGVAPYMGH